MEASLPILISYKKLQEQMAQGKYYSALKTLQEIEHGHLPGVMQFKFAEVIKNSFPKLRQVRSHISLNSSLELLLGGSINVIKRAKRLPRNRSSKCTKSRNRHFAEVFAKKKTK